ncbi:hypothetical protein XU18_0454 [Perkinsela sp. CCAP 1560/4]|nr:hypothetical protein XU18_0454 [Perkinsela sp. CCAP 1560/4]|eukprot:KNH09769.1 hypothetical protein XU18_0454 [Perkinsela sp. CCAP 1560/4]
MFNWLQRLVNVSLILICLSLAFIDPENQLEYVVGIFVGLLVPIGSLILKTCWRKVFIRGKSRSLERRVEEQPCVVTISPNRATSELQQKEQQFTAYSLPEALSHSPNRSSLGNQVQRYLLPSVPSPHRTIRQRRATKMGRKQMHVQDSDMGSTINRRKCAELSTPCLENLQACGKNILSADHCEPVSTNTRSAKRKSA